jgi:hypothetical protein
LAYETAVELSLLNVALDTAPVRGGIDRIAIMLDKKPQSIPVVLSVPLGRSFAINGLSGDGESARLAARLLGKTDAEHGTKEIKEHAEKFLTP